MIDPRLITFLTVSKLQSYTKAGDILGLTQPAVSQHIKHLEEHYKVKLINKSGRTISLTEEGKLLKEYALKMQILQRTIENKLYNKSSIVKRYKIGATKSIGGYVLPDLLGSHKMKYPNIDIILEVGNTEEIINKLIKKHINLALVEGPFDKNKFNHCILKEDELVLAVSPEHPFASKDSVCLDDVLSGNLILREEGSGTRKVFENRLVELGYNLNKLNIYMEVGDITAIKSLVSWNLGYTIISKEVIQQELNEGSLKAIPICSLKIIRGFYFVWNKTDQDEFIRKFIDFCLS